MKKKATQTEKVILVSVGVLFFLLLLTKLYTWGYEYATKKYSPSVEQTTETERK